MITLVIGAGFSQDLLNLLDLEGRVDNRVLLPAPRGARVFWDESGRRRNGRLWSPNMFPFMLDAWTEWNAHSSNMRARESYLQFCAQFAQLDHINPTKTEGLLTVANDHPGYQLRSYLWCLFADYDRQVRNALERNTAIHTWRWSRILVELNRNELAVISFNYDCIAENAISTLIGDPQTPVHSVAHEVEKRWDRSRPIVIKPHGSIAFTVGSGISLGPRPWYGGSRLIANVSTDSGPYTVQYPPKNCPALPDLVPPGHAGSHLGNWHSGATDAAKMVINSCDILVFCGLSADEPDTTEVRELLCSLKGDTPVIQAGLTRFGDDRNTAAELLKAASGRYKFHDLQADPNGDLLCKLIRESH